MNIFIKKILVATFCVLAFAGCKKYPENSLWFKKPKQVFKGGKITMYTINDVDQMPAIRAMYNTFPYNYYGKPIPDVFDLSFSYDSGSEELSTDYGKGYLVFSKNGKDADINFSQTNESSGAKNMFIAPTNWKILRLTKSGQLKLKGVINFSLCIIQFN